MTYSGNDQAAFLEGYREAMLWANCYIDVDGECVSVDDASGYDYDDAQIDTADALAFWADNAELLEQAGATPAQHGHDFALTRNRHGAGFWDRGYGIAGDLLTEAAKVYGSHSIMIDAYGAITNENG